MALSFHPSSTSPSHLRCTIHRDNHDLIFIYVNGYKFSIPQARDYCDVVEHLLILQEAFSEGFTLSDDIEKDL